MGVCTQSDADFVRLGTVMRVMRVVGFLRRNLLDCCRMLEGAVRFVYIEINGVRTGGVYWKCGEGVHDIQR